MTLKLYWDIMPVTGTLELSQKGNSKFSMPPEYVHVAEEECLLVPGGPVNTAGTQQDRSATAKLGRRPRAHPQPQ